jgi:hypothetical protein
LRDEHAINLEANINAIIENNGSLAASASNVALSTVDWNINAPFSLLQNIFENITMGCKQTLFTSFTDRELRLSTFKNVIMKYEMNNCRNLNILNTLVEGSRENYRVISQIWEISVSTFSGFETNMVNVFQILNGMRKIIVNKHQIMVKQNMIEMNLIIKLQENDKQGVNILLNRIVNGVEEMISTLQLKVLTEIGQKLSIVEASIQEIRKSLAKMLNIGMDRMHNAVINEVNINSVNLRNDILKSTNEQKNDVTNTVMENLEGLGFNIKKEFERFEKIEDVKLLTIDDNIKAAHDNICYGIKMAEEIMNERKTLTYMIKDDLGNFLSEFF